MNKIIQSVHAAIKPEVAMPATFLSYSDRNPGTVIRIISDKCIEVETCDWKVVGGPYEIGEERKYKYFPNKITEKSNGRLFTLRKNGKWIEKGSAMNTGTAIMLGTRERYQDPSF